MGLLNQARTRRFILATVRQMRPGMPLTRVSQGALDFYEGRIREWIKRDVEHHPSRGATFCELWTRETARP